MSISSAESSFKTLGPFRLSVDWVRPLGELLPEAVFDGPPRDFSDYDYSRGPNVNDTGLGLVEGELVTFDHETCTTNILAGLKRANLRPALFRELVAFGIKFPEAQRKFAIVALGSVLRHSYLGWRAPVLTGNDYERKLEIHRAGNGWSPAHNFLVFPKDPKGL